MKFSTFERIFKKYTKYLFSAQQALQSYPEDFQNFYLEMEVTKKTQMTVEFLLDELLGDELAELVYWFMYDNDFGRNKLPLSVGTYIIDFVEDEEEFLNFLKIALVWDDDTLIDPNLRT